MTRGLLQVAEQAAGSATGAAESAVSTVVSVAEANPAVAGVALLGVAAAGLGIFVYEEIQHYKKSEHEAEIHRILQFWETSGLKALGIHEPFVLGDGNDSLKAKRLKKERSRDTTLRYSVPPNLRNFRNAVDEALRVLDSYIYDASHGHGTGMSTFVAKYQQNILRSDALRFEGREREIALMEALTNFINQYARDENNDHTQRIRFLTSVYTSLDAACDGLRIHEKSKPFIEIIQDILSILCDSGDQLIRFLIKMITPNKDWNFIDDQPLSILKAGIAAPATGERIIFCLPSPFGGEQKIPSTFMDTWFHLLIQYYEESRNPDSRAIQIPPLSELVVPSLEELTREKKKWRDIFKNSDNFFTQELDPEEQDVTKKQFVPIRDMAKIRKRLCLCADIWVFVHEISTLQSKFTELERFSGSYGTHEAEAEQYEEYYARLNGLYKKFTHQMLHIDSEVRAIKTENRGMPIVTHMDFQRDFLKLIDTTGSDIGSNMTLLERCRKHFARTSHQTAAAAEHQLLQNMRALDQVYSAPEALEHMIRPIVHHDGDDDQEPLDTGSENGNNAAEAEPVMQAAQPAANIPPVAALTSIGVIEKLYKSNAKISFFNAWSDILKKGVTAAGVIAEFERRGADHPGASRQTLVDLGLSPGAAP